MAKSSNRIFFTVDEEMYTYLSDRAKQELRKVGDMAKYLMIRGIEAEKATHKEKK